MDGENEQNRCLTANVIAAINKRRRRPCQKTATTDNDDVQTDLDVDQSRIDFSAENPPYEFFLDSSPLWCLISRVED